MATAIIMATIMLAQGPAQATEVGYDELAANRNAAAIERIESNDALKEQDPARLINLGIAHARQGRTEVAREMFERAAWADRLDLETGSGAWIDSRDLALRALAALDRGDFAAQTRTAMPAGLATCGPLGVWRKRR